jgi:hypothetical protein
MLKCQAMFKSTFPKKKKKNENLIEQQLSMEAITHIG